MDILEEIVAHKVEELQERMSFISPRRLYSLVEEQIKEETHAPVSMRQALMDSSTGIIAEFKRKSPSKGWIKQEGKAAVIPLSYQQNGASALSILTDTKYFGGYDEYIQQARAAGVTIPILYKNFVIDEYQLFQARYCGASAVLIIAACLEKDKCKALLHTAHELGLEALLEMHGDEDFAYADIEPDMYGINNRNLGTFVTDVNNSFRLAERLPKGVCTVSESGIGDPDTIRQLRKVGFHGFLMGEHFMKAEDPGKELAQFVKQIKE